jgi:hypothetical protein
LKEIKKNTSVLEAVQILGARLNGFKSADGFIENIPILSLITKFIINHNRLVTFGNLKSLDEIPAAESTDIY